jgi:polyketide cyclase/dehydrase/lipid transport protein
MARLRIEHRATTAADPATVYALLRDGATWPEWSPIDSFELERPGTGEPEGVGAVRVLRSGRVTGRDTIVELVADRRFSYTHASSLPVKNYRGDVDLEPVDGGTEIRWVSQFDPKIPGTGAAMRRALDGFVASLVSGLADRAAADAAARRSGRVEETPAVVRPLPA